MSTSESGKNAPHSPTSDLRTASDFRTSLPGDAQFVPAGLPDAAVLARMANEFFTALPLSETSVADPQHGAAVPGAPEPLGAASNRAAFVAPPGAPSLPSTPPRVASLPP